MGQEQKQCLKPKLGEQLTGLSPTVCRRAIAAIRKEYKRRGDSVPKNPLPTYCEGLLELLDKQTYIGMHYDTAHLRSILLDALNQVELFLNVVEGVEPTTT